MSTPAATAALTARLAEWKNVPSPTFWKMWDRSVNGARPIQVAPSPPIWWTIWARSSIHSAMAWQPTPAPTNEPSGAVVERLWGQPLHQYGVRATARRACSCSLLDEGQAGLDRYRQGADVAS